MKGNYSIKLLHVNNVANIWLSMNSNLQPFAADAFTAAAVILYISASLLSYITLLDVIEEGTT